MKKNLYFLCYCLLLTITLQATPTVENLHICTVASYQNKELDQLLHSCNHFGVKIDVLGLGLPYKGHGQKLFFVREYLDHFPDDDLILFVDAYDVLFLANAKTILDKFLEKQMPCIFAAEHKNCNSWPHHNLAQLYQESPTDFKYLNSGTYITYVGFFKQLLDDMGIIEYICDQGQLSVYYALHQDEILLDYYCELFLPLVHVGRQNICLDRKNISVACLLTGTKTCIVHGNSPDEKKFYQIIYETLFAGKK